MQLTNNNNAESKVSVHIISIFSSIMQIKIGPRKTDSLTGE